MSKPAPTGERAIQWDCGQVVLRFYDCFDRFDYEGMAALFTPDGVWHRAGKALQGRDALVAELSTRATTQTIRHVITNLLVDVQAESRATASFYITAYRHDDGQPRAGVPVIRAPYLMLTASAVLVATPAGWRMSEQVMKREFEFAA